ncbi:MAG: UDP-N-acetyl-2-amino-2-deoxyglucuronate dehydrogenase [Flavobacteriales bacterium]|jgi:UDP-N-acetyl-2-amino-2-deoxyglucuronate dehydrogenase
MKKFALIGAAGYIAPRHMKAIKDTNNDLVAALDTFDSVGIMDSYFPEASFFTEFERFDRHIDKLRRTNQGVDFVSICSPNYLHDSHIRFGLRNNADVICEKPLVLTPWNVDGLKEVEADSGRSVNNILQLRLHPSIIALKQKIDAGPKDKIYDIQLTYLTSRGKWYHHSWKGDNKKSGGIATNIGVHFYDMLLWVFGGLKENKVHISSADTASGYMELEKARVKWLLSIDYNRLPEAIKAKGQTTYRSITVDGDEIEFSGGFTELHTRSYEEIIKGNGFGMDEVKPAIELVFDIRNAELQGLTGDYHPMAK